MLRPLLVSAITFVFLACSSSASAPPAPSTPIVDGGRPNESAALPIDAVDAAKAADASPSRSSVTLTGFTARSAVFRSLRTREGDALIEVILGDADDVCTSPRTEKLTPALQLTLRAQGAMKPGSFPVVLDTQLGGSGPAPQSTVVDWQVYDVGDDKCALSNHEQGATGGTIDVTAFDEDTAIDGSLSITLDPDGTKVEGTFHAIPCPYARPETVACMLDLR